MNPPPGAYAEQGQFRLSFTRERAAILEEVPLAPNAALLDEVKLPKYADVVVDCCRIKRAGARKLACRDPRVTTDRLVHTTPA